MKKISYVLSLVLLVVSCNKDVKKEYVTFSGKIIDKNSDSLLIRSKSFLKKINVNEDGTFSDTLKVKTGPYNLFDGNESTTIYLKNGFELFMDLDTKQFDETVSYSGIGAEASNYIAAKALMQEVTFNDKEMFELEKPQFDLKREEVRSKFEVLLSRTTNLDSTFVNSESKWIEKLNNYLVQLYEENKVMATVLVKGNPSPKFNNYENFKGGKTSLDDLKGKYVYIDVWATWCGPCKREIPYLKEVEKTYHNKNIEFVSLSVDKIKDYDAWKKMIIDKEMGGVQLIADNDWNSNFVQDYKIKGIPRFILIDPSGNIVSADAPRPSSKDLITLFNELKI